MSIVFRDIDREGVNDVMCHLPQWQWQWHGRHSALTLDTSHFTLSIIIVLLIYYHRSPPPHHFSHTYSVLCCAVLIGIGNLVSRRRHRLYCTVCI